MEIDEFKSTHVAKTFKPPSESVNFIKNKYDELDEVNSKIIENKFKLKMDGSVDARDKDFRKCMSVVSGKPYPVNKDLTPDMRFTKNPEILKIKLEKLLTQKIQ